MQLEFRVVRNGGIYTVQTEQLRGVLFRGMVLQFKTVPAVKSFPFYEEKFHRRIPKYRSGYEFRGKDNLKSDHFSTGETKEQGDKIFRDVRRLRRKIRDLKFQVPLSEKVARRHPLSPDSCSAIGGLLLELVTFVHDPLFCIYLCVQAAP